MTMGLLDWQRNGWLRAHKTSADEIAALFAAAGYQPEKGGQHHFRAIQSLSETIGVDKKTIGLLEAYRRKRNIVEYERSGTVSEADVTTMRELARLIRDQVRAWITETHPALLTKSRRK